KKSLATRRSEAPEKTLGSKKTAPMTACSASILCGGTRSFMLTPPFYSLTYASAVTFTVIIASTSWCNLIGTFVYPNDRKGSFISILRRSTLISWLLCNSSAICLFVTDPNNLPSSPDLVLISTVMSANFCFYFSAFAFSSALSAAFFCFFVFIFFYFLVISFCAY